MIKNQIAPDLVVTPQTATLRLPHREGDRPATTSTNPHSRLDQRLDPSAVKSVFDSAANLSGVEARRSIRAQAGTSGLYVEPKAALGGEEAFLLGREFAHFHPLTLSDVFNFVVTRAVMNTKNKDKTYELNHRASQEED